jgi:hypothetical protein
VFDLAVLSAGLGASARLRDQKAAGSRKATGAGVPPDTARSAATLPNSAAASAVPGEPGDDDEAG